MMMSPGRTIESLIYSGHAVQQMFARGISVDEVRAVVDGGEAIASYPNDRPYPSELLLGLSAGRPLHVVLAYDKATKSGYVVTAYVPDPELWNNDYRTRRRP